MLASVQHLSNLNPLSEAFALIAHKHCALGVQAEHYKIVHDNFLAATANILGAAVTAEVAAAWSEVLLYLATALINLEAKVYKDAAARTGGWMGTKPFRVARVVAEDGKDFRSVYLEPADGSAAPAFTPGQYVTLCENPTSETLFAPRHYTISHPTQLRITVRKEHAPALSIGGLSLSGDKTATGSNNSGVPDGAMSSFVHGLAVGDVVRLRPPMGTFTRTGVPSASPEIYISSGSGITPIAAMAQQAAAENKTVIVMHIGAEAPLFEETRKVIASQAGPHSAAMYCRSDAVGTLGCVVAALGIDLEKAVFFVSGSPDMMVATGAALTRVGVTHDRIRHEAFGPKIDMFAQAAKGTKACPF